MNKKYSITILMVFMCSLGLYSTSQANKVADKAVDTLKDKATNRVKETVRKIPGIGKIVDAWDAFAGNSMEEKVDRIDRRSEDHLDEIRELSREAIKTKKKVEEMYYFKQRSQQIATSLADGLRRGKVRNFFGVLIEDGLKFPINPAEYIPNIPATAELRRNLDLDLSFEKGVLNEQQYLFRSTRRALLAEGGLLHSKRFEEEYKKAEAYEGNMLKALRAKEEARIKIYKSEIERLEKELKVLEEHKKKPGLTISDVVQLESLMENKRARLMQLDNELDRKIKENLMLSEEEKLNLGLQMAFKGLSNLDRDHRDEKERIKQQYRHLSLFNY